MPLIGSGFVRMMPSSTSPGTPISRLARPKSPFNEGDYVGAADSGSTFRISGSGGPASELEFWGAPSLTVFQGRVLALYVLSIRTVPVN